MPFIVLILMLVLMWAFVILPQQRRMKAHRAFVDQLQVGDDIVTTAGLFGTVTAIEADRVRLRVAPEVEIVVARLAVGQLQPDPEAEAAVAPETADEAGPPSETTDGE